MESIDTGNVRVAGAGPEKLPCKEGKGMLRVEGDLSHPGDSRLLTSTYMEAAETTCVSLAESKVNRRRTC